MGAVSLFLVLSPEKTPFLLDFVFFVSPAFAGFLVRNLGFHQKGAPFLSRPGEVVLKMSKHGPLLQTWECNVPKTRIHRQIEKCLVPVKAVSSHFGVPTHVIGS